MARTILEYLKTYGQYSFKEKPFNEVDSLIVCQFSYLKLDGMVPLVTENKKSVSLQEIFEHESYERLYADERFEKENRALFLGMLQSKRYATVKLNCYINIIESEWETQFSAVTFILEDGTLYLAYRGTDETIIGWKEDFNMAFLDPVPGQSYATKYMNMVTNRLRHPFLTGGHSKGGNFALYAALNCRKEVQDFILQIYIHDGPGFRPEVLERFDYDSLKERIVRILPHSSLVGMLLSSGDSSYQVIKSNSFGLLQHDPYTWLVEEDHFIKMKDIYRPRKFSDGTINEWILSLDEQQVRTFVDTLYQVVSASKAKTLNDFTSDWKTSMLGVLSAIKEIDDDTRKVIRKVIKSLFSMARERMKLELSFKD